MSDIVNGAPPHAAPHHAPIRALLRAGSNEEAIGQLCGITVTRPDDLEAKELVFDAFFPEVRRLGIPCGG